MVVQFADKVQVLAQRSWKQSYGVGPLVAGLDEVGAHSYYNCLSGNCFQHQAFAVGSHSQDPKTYLARRFETFQNSSRVSQWIAYHGLALNVTTNLTLFQLIVPCCIRNREVGRIKGILGEFGSSNQHGASDINYIDDFQLIDTTHKSLIKEFYEVFQLELALKPISML